MSQIFFAQRAHQVRKGILLLRDKSETQKADFLELEGWGRDLLLKTVIEEEEIVSLRVLLQLKLGQNVKVSSTHHRQARFTHFEAMPKPELFGGGLSDDKRHTPLVIASSGGNRAEILEMLLDSDNTVVELLLKELGEPYVERFDSALRATGAAKFDRKDSIEVLKLLLETGLDPNIQAGENGWTCLLVACCDNYLEMASLLLKHGANPYLTEKHKKNCLMMSAQNGHTSIVSMLLNSEYVDNHRIIDERNDRGWTALALAYDHSVVVELLLNHGADPNIATDDGWTPLMLACQRKGVPATVKLLLRYSELAIEHTNNLGMSAYGLARWNDLKEIIEILELAGAKERSLLDDMKESAIKLRKLSWPSVNKDEWRSDNLSNGTKDLHVKLMDLVEDTMLTENGAEEFSELKEMVKTGLHSAKTMDTHEDDKPQLDYDIHTYRESLKASKQKEQELQEKLKTADCESREKHQQFTELENELQRIKKEMAVVKDEHDMLLKRSQKAKESVDKSSQAETTPNVIDEYKAKLEASEREKQELEEATESAKRMGRARDTVIVELERECQLLKEKTSNSEINSKLSHIIKELDELRKDGPRRDSQLLEGIQVCVKSEVGGLKETISNNESKPYQEKLAAERHYLEELLMALRKTGQEAGIAHQQLSTIQEKINVLDKDTCTAAVSIGEALQEVLSKLSAIETSWKKVCPAITADPPALHEFMNIVVCRIPSLWYPVGIQLKIDQAELETLMRSKDDTCKCWCAVFTWWKDKCKMPFTWETIIYVLRCDSIEQNSLADSVEKEVANFRRKS